MEKTEAQLRQERIKYLKRQEERRRRLPDLLQGLSIIADRPFSETDVLSLDETDQFQTRVNRSNFGLNYLTLSFPATEAAHLSLILGALEEKLNRPDNYFYSLDFRKFGILRTNTAFVIRNFEKLFELHEDALAFYDHKVGNGFWLDCTNEYWFLDNKAQELFTYELKVFGAEWIYYVNNAYYATA
ncbi:MAG TPA: hypothetical protein VGO45_03415 [Bacteroidia bacterium]|jgi:hypothetical protein|nr:hypothetical protein [Bacteroidia bacterium]